MKNKFFNHRWAVISNYSAIFVFLVFILSPLLFESINFVSIILAVIFIPVIIIGYIMGLKKHEYDKINFTVDGVIWMNAFKKTFISWDKVDKVNYGWISITTLAGSVPVKKLAIRARSEDDEKTITIYRDNREEILKSIKYYKGINKDTIKL